jgi:MFS family permease
VEVKVLGAINLFNPTRGSVTLALVTALLLGLVHGVTPDEHTWPITFSYSVGSYSSKGGRRVGFLFSLAFTLQRALASEFAYFALTSFDSALRWNFEIYIVVGVVMALSGWHVLRRGHPLHLTLRDIRAEISGKHDHPEFVIPKELPWYMPLVHGFIAGWGVGAFAVIIYTVLAPEMPNGFVGWVPGALFGVGTMIMQITLGSLFGAWMQRRKLGSKAKEYLARMMSARTLLGAGFGFVVVGMLGVFFPEVLSSISFVTPIHIHNLHNIGVGFFLAVVLLFAVALWSFKKTIREVKTLGLAVNEQANAVSDGQGLKS